MFSWLPPEWSLPTLLSDGSQNWNDQLWRAGFRLQSHSAGEVWRVVCPNGSRQATGTETTCVEAFERLAGPAVPFGPDEHLVVLVHGLLRTRRCMKPLAASLTQAGLGPAIRVDYASTCLPIREHAASLRRLVEGLVGSSRISFVGHSMGNIVLRHAIGDWQQAGDPAGILNRLHRVVMLGPPNQGAAIARLLGDLKLFRFVTGDGGRQLGNDWESLKPHLATPPCPFAILAGDLSPYRANNPLIGKSNDLLVSVEEAYLEGVTSFAKMTIPHATLISDHRALEFVTDFLTADNPPSSAVAEAATAAPGTAATPTPARSLPLQPDRP